MKESKAFWFLFLTIIIITYVPSCRHVADISDLPEICFEGDILPVFRNNCSMTACHDGSGESDLILSNYENIIEGLNPGDPFGSEIYKAITATWGEDKMPPDQPLSLENRTLIRLWIEQGALQTSCPDGTGGGGTGYSNPRACFSRDILPVLVSKCASTQCHDAITHEEGYNFTTYTTTMTAVRPGNPGDSKLYKVISTSSGDDKMPPAGKSQLTVAEIDSIRKWIIYGALNETCGESCDTLNPVTFSGTIWPAIQASCTGCHSGASPSGNIPLGSYSNVAAVASSGLLIKSLKGIGATRMPPAGAFTACRVRQFEIWVNNGYLNN